METKILGPLRLKDLEDAITKMKLNNYRIEKDMKVSDFYNLYIERNNDDRD